MDRLIDCILSGSLERLRQFKLETLAKDRFERVKDIWLKAAFDLRARMLRTPKEYWQDYKMSLIKDFLRVADDETIVPDDLLCIRVVLTKDEFYTLSIQEQYFVIRQMLYNYHTVSVVPKLKADEYQSFLVSLKLSGVVSVASFSRLVRDSKRLKFFKKSSKN